jgi:hypothetical protein
MTDEDAQQDMDWIKAACEQLGEHFDTVQIFVTRFDPEDGTTNIDWGSGDWFARYGKVKQWVLKEERRIALGVEPENS